MAIENSEPRFGIIVPHLVVADVDEAVQFYVAAFDAVELYRSPSPSGAGQHVHLRVWDALVFLSSEEPSERMNRVDLSHLASPETLGGTTTVLQIRVHDVDAAYDRAINSGATPVWPPADMFWGDRYAWVRDPSGHVWALCAVLQVLSPQAVAERMRSSIVRNERTKER